MFNLVLGFVINDFVDVLQDSRSGNFSNNPGCYAVKRFGIISFDVELVAQLRKGGFNSFSDLLELLTY